MDNNNNVVTPVSTPAAGDGLIAQVQSGGTSVVVTPTPVTPGSKTPPENLLAALQEERRKRKELEDKLNNTTPTLSDDQMSDEGRMLKTQIVQLNNKIEEMEQESRLKQLNEQFPALKDKSAEFQEFRKEYPHHKLENVAKIFLAENDLIVPTPTRKGLEQPTGGTRVPAQGGMSTEDIKNLRDTNFRKYTEMLMTGKINPADIK